MQFTAAQIASMISGKTEGDAGVGVASFGKIEEAQAGQLAFLANPKYEDYLYTTAASVVIVNESLVLRKPVTATLIRVPDPYGAFATLLEMYQQLQARQLSGIQQPCFIDPSAQIGEDVYIGAFAYIGAGVQLGKGVKIYPHTYVGDHTVIGEGSIIYSGVQLYHHTEIGRQVIIHAGTVIGSDGFGFAPQADGTYKKVPQTGNVVIEDRVEIGANTTIDRATIGSTLIRTGAKLDNLLQIAHNVEIGQDTVIAAQTGISGSTRIGNRVMIGGQAGIVGHIQIADGTRINAQSGVSKSIKTPNTAVTGSPAFDYTAALRSQAAARHLPELEQRVKALEQQLRELLAK